MFVKTIKLKKANDVDNVLTMFRYLSNDYHYEFNINIIDNIDTIKESYFGGVDVINSITIPDSVIKIEEHEFEKIFLEERFSRLLPSPSGKVANRAAFRDDLTEGDNKSLLRFALHFIPYRFDFHFIPSNHFPRRRKRVMAHYKLTPKGKARVIRNYLAAS